MAGTDAHFERRRSRGLIFAGVLVATLLAGAGYVLWAVLRDDTGGGQSGAAVDLGERPSVVFQDVQGNADDASYSRVAVIPADGEGERKTTTAVCARIYYAAGRGLCLKIISPSRLGDLVVGQSRYEATITGPDLETRHDLKLAGLPSRARISSDGRYGATTVFVTGHSYAQEGFSTQTKLIDMRRGKVLSDLERDFTVIKDGKRIKEIDFNFWGVTFSKRSDRFYATLGTGGKTYLLEGDVRLRRARVLRENVECPSLSPDDKRIAYKKREGKGWRLHVLELATMKDVALAEKRSVDDQVEWLDDDRVLYGLSRDTWVIPADGSGAPEKFIDEGLSPAVVRG